MPGLIPRRRPSEELSESDNEVADGSATPTSPVSNLSKRPRLAVGNMSDVSSSSYTMLRTLY